ncbi:MAG TPA: CHAT domain-containing protein [Longimicrobiales bacterium]|nr:CHAT domain-containing protein [Longimicrobiales bacterium]
MLATAAADRYPAVAGRARWVRALTEARLGTYERGLAWYAEGMEAYTRAGENENVGAVEFLISQSLLLLGQSRAAERRALRAMELLAPYPSSPRLHDGLLSFGRQVNGLGLHATALAIHGEGLSVAARTGREKDPGEVYVRLAQTAVAAGRRRDAERYLTAARAVFAAVSDSIMRQRGEIDIVDTESALVLHDRPAEALRLLSDAVSYFTTQRLATGSIRALTRRSAALRAEGRHQEAAVDLDRAIALYEQNLDGSNAAARAALRESAAPAYDAMVVAQLAMNRPDSAFAYLMRSHGSSAAAVEAAARRRGMRVLAYALLPDELVTWSYENDAWSAERRPTPAAVVEQHINTFVDALRRRDDARATATGRVLHELLVPASLGGAPILFVPDRALSSLPFAALVDPASGKFLAERALVSMYAAGRASKGRGVQPRSRVLVASGARFDPLTFPDLAPLPGAEAEASRVTGLYDAATLIDGDDATPGRLLSELQRHDVLHFAGHARALPATPELSFLVTASDARGANRITASEIMRLDLGHLSLVVLGVCSAAERGDGRSGEVNGLAQAFLTAGAGAVIASVWEVDDAATTELLTRMHAGVLAGSNAAAALRNAQLELLRSSDARLRSPAAWAGFQHYTS